MRKYHVYFIILIGIGFTMLFVFTDGIKSKVFLLCAVISFIIAVSEYFNDQPPLGPVNELPDNVKP